MRLGINLMAWTAAVGAKELALFPRLAALGYQGVELPVFAPEQLDTAGVRRALQESGLACTVSSALPRGASLLSTTEQASGIAYLRRCLEAAAQVHADVLCGPLYAPVGQLSGSRRSADEWQHCVQALREVARIAAGCGVPLALEPLNRFETYFLNTAGDARRLVEDVGSPMVGIHLDTFHMNIEEQDLPAALRQAGPQLMHVHCSENDRGVVGSGHVPWRQVFEALQSIGYARWLVCETFAGHIPELAAATAIWRPLVPDPETYARESLHFLQAHLMSYGIRHRQGSRGATR